MINPSIAIELNWEDITLGDLRALMRLTASLPDDTKASPAIDPGTLEQNGIRVWVLPEELPAGGDSNDGS